MTDVTTQREPLKPAYLLTGGDEMKIGAACKRLEARAKSEGASLDYFEPAACRPETVAQALEQMSLLAGSRIVLADGVEQWKAAEIDPVVKALNALAPDTIAVFICRKKPLVGILKAIEALGGEVKNYEAPKPSELPGRMIKYAAELGIELESVAAQLLVDVVGPSQQRLITELDKLTTFVFPAMRISVEAVEQLTVGESSAQIFDLADAVMARDPAAATQLANELRATGEKESSIVFALVRAVSQALRAAALVEQGRGADVQSALKLPPWLAKKAASQGNAWGSAALKRAVVELSALDMAIKGGTALANESDFAITLDRLIGVGPES